MGDLELVRRGQRARTDCMETFTFSAFEMTKSSIATSVIEMIKYITVVYMTTVKTMSCCIAVHRSHLALSLFVFL